MSRRSSRKKKGSLDISINAIVILVVAIVVLGLILGMVRTWFAKAGGEVEGLLDVGDIKDHADANTPFRVPSTIQVKTGDSVSVSAAFYNTAGSEQTNVDITLNSCKSVLNNQNIDPTELPVLVSIPSSKVGASSEQGFKLRLNTNLESGKVPFGTYLCQMGVTSDAGELRTAVFTLEVTQ